jgi:hypothetical protein
MAQTATAFIAKTRATAKANPKATPVSGSDSVPLALSDDQLDQIVCHAAVLHPGLPRLRQVGV